MGLNLGTAGWVWDSHVGSTETQGSRCEGPATPHCKLWGMTPPLGAPVSSCLTEGVRTSGPCAALKELPYRQVIKTEAQAGVWNETGRVAGTILEGSPRQLTSGAGALGQCGQIASRGLNVITTGRCEALPQLPPGLSFA